MLEPQESANNNEAGTQAARYGGISVNRPHACAPIHGAPRAHLGQRCAGAVLHGCLVCMRICPTDCIDVAMMDNPKHAEGDSTRRKIVEYFDLNVADCIMCGLCVEYCNFDAIIMSDNFDASQYARPNLMFDLDQLLEAGKEQEAKGRWSPPEAKKSARRSAAQSGGTPAAGADDQVKIVCRFASKGRRTARPTCLLERRRGSTSRGYDNCA